MIAAPTPLFASGRYIFLCIVPLSWLLLDMSYQSKVAALHIGVLIVSTLFCNPDFSMKFPNYRWNVRSACIGHLGRCGVRYPPGWELRLYQVPKGSTEEVPLEYQQTHYRCEIS